MAKHRYRNDYELTQRKDARGRERTVVSYTGASYLFTASQERIRRERRVLLLLTGAGWVCYLGGMFLESTFFRRLYAALPYACCGIPLYLLTECAAALLRMKEPAQRRDADRMNQRFPAAALFLTVFSGFSLIGAGAALIGWALRGSPDEFLLFPGDPVFLLCAAGLFFCGTRFFARRSFLTMKEGGDGEPH